MSIPKIITCYSTISDEQNADLLISQLLHKKLIACGVSWPVNSQYQWGQEFISEGEYVIYLKSKIELKDLLIKRIQELHPYDVPCILIHEVECNQAYYSWVTEQTS